MSGESSSTVREEVINVKLAELLSQDGIVSVPETILRRGGVRRLPDVICDYRGVRVVIEGRTDGSGIRESLDRDCEKRLEEGIAALTIGVAYPEELRNSDFAELEENMRQAILPIKVYSEAGTIGWLDSNYSSLSATLRTAYENLVREDVVNRAVEELGSSIEDAASDLARFRGTEQRLRDLLVLPSVEEEP